MLSTVASQPFAELEELREQEQKSDDNYIEPETFTLVSAPIKATLRNSSIANLIEDLFSEKSKILDNYHVEHITDSDGHEAWLIHFDAEPKNHLFPDFQRVGSHFRGDKRFANDNTLKAKQGFAACHYTEEYARPGTPELIVVHAYIGRNGTFISCQMKHYPFGKDNASTKMQESKVAALSDKVQQNSSCAIELVEAFLAEKDKRYMNAKAQSYKIESELKHILQKILMNGADISERLRLANEYEAVTKKFLAEIAIINRYNDQETDKRGTQRVDLTQYIKFPETTLEPTKFEEVAQSQDELADSSVFTSESLLMNAKQKRAEQLDRERDDLIIKIKELEEKLNILQSQSREDIKVLISLHKFKKDLQEKLIDLAFFSNLTKENDTFLKRISIKMNEIVNLMDKFKEAVKLGEVGRVIQLYPYVKDDDFVPVLQDFLLSLIAAKEEHLENLIKIANYFYQESYLYGMLVAKNYCYPMRNVNASIIFHAFLAGNYSVFKLFLDQDANPNGVGIVYQNEVASIIKAIVFVMRSPNSPFVDLRYIETLLSFRALACLKDSSSFSGALEVNKKELKNDYYAEVVSNIPELALIFGVDSGELSGVLSQNSALEVLCFKNPYPSFKLLKLLIPHSDLSALALAFVSLVNRNEVNSRLILGTTGGHIFLCRDDAHADSTAQRLEIESPARNVSYLLYHTNAQQAAKWFENTEALLMAFSEKYFKILDKNLKQIANLSKTLIEQGKQAKATDLIKEVNFYTAALYLQILNPEPAIVDAEQIVQIFCFLGQACSHSNLIQAKNYFSNAISCCQNSQGVEQLKKTPLFSFAQRKFWDLEQSLRISNPAITPLAMHTRQMAAPLIELANSHKPKRQEKKNPKKKK